MYRIPVESRFANHVRACAAARMPRDGNGFALLAWAREAQKAPAKHRPLTPPEVALLLAAGRREDTARRLAEEARSLAAAIQPPPAPLFGRAVAMREELLRRTVVETRCALVVLPLLP